MCPIEPRSRCRSAGVSRSMPGSRGEILRFQILTPDVQTKILLNPDWSQRGSYVIHYHRREALDAWRTREDHVTNCNWYYEHLRYVMCLIVCVLPFNDHNYVYKYIYGYIHICICVYMYIYIYTHAHYNTCSYQLINYDTSVRMSNEDDMFSLYAIIRTGRRA